MAEKKREPEFTVTDRRKFTFEGDVRDEEKQEKPAEAARPAEPVSEAAPASPPMSQAAPPAHEHEQQEVAPPSNAEQAAQEQAYRDSNKEMDRQIEQHLGGRKPSDYEMTFERFVASIYMTALMQLGLLHEEGRPPMQPDLLGARQTIDTIAILHEKTKGNLTTAEQNFIQNALYELRMAYLEVTNALTRPPAQPGTGAGIK